MRDLKRMGLAAGVAGALALFGSAQAQTPSSTQGGGTTPGGPADTTGGTPGARPAEPGTSSAGGASSGTADRGMASASKPPDKAMTDKLERIHAANQAELQLAQLGAQNGTSPDVKQFAQQMQTDHQQMDQQLTQYGQESGAQLEGKTYTKELDRAKKDLEGLQKKSGADFDKAFMSKMVKDHEKDLKAVKDAAKDAHQKNENQLASVLDQAQTTIQGHLDHAKQVEASVKKEKSSRHAAGEGAASGTSGTGSTQQQQPSQMPSDEQLKGRGDTGGPTPQSSPPDQGTSSPTTPGGGEKGSSSDSGAHGTK